MSKEANYFRIGLFTLVATTVLIAFLIVLGIGNLFKQDQYAETYFNESVKGLEVGSTVKYRGISVGKVEEIDVISDVYSTKYFDNSNKTKRYIYVRFSLLSRLGAGQFKSKENALKAIQSYIKQGLRVSLATKDLVGNVYLELNFTEPEKNPVLPISWTPKYLYIPSAKSTLSRFTDSIDKIFSEIEEIDFKQVVNNFDNFTTVATKAIDNANVKTLSSQLIDTLKKIGDLSNTVNNLLSSDESKELAGSIKEDSELFKQTLKDTSAAMKELNSLTSRANQLTASQQNTIVDTLSALKQMSINLEAVTETLKNNPSDVIFGEPEQPVDPSK